MKLAAVAPTPAALRSAASLLTFYRDVLDKLAVWRLTERDAAMEDAMREVSEDLLGRCALLARKMRRAGLLEEREKIAELRLADNPAHNPKRVCKQFCVMSHTLPGTGEGVMYGNARVRLEV